MYRIKFRQPVTNCANSKWIFDENIDDCSEKQSDKKCEFRKLLKITIIND